MSREELENNMALLQNETNLVAANTKTPVNSSMPSNSVRNWKKRGTIIMRKGITKEHNMKQANKKLTWLTTRSVTPVLSCPLFGAMESNSSKKRRHGAAAAAFEKISRTCNQSMAVSSRHHVPKFCGRKS